MAPEDLVVLYVGEAQEAGELMTQRSLAQMLSSSQPSVSRALARLVASGQLRVHPVSLLAAGTSERGYSLTAEGTARLGRVRAELRDLLWPGSTTSLGDLETTLPGTRLSSLLSARRAGTAPEELLARYQPEDDVRAARKGRPPSRPRSPPGAEGASSLGPPPLVGRLPERLRLAQSLRKLRSRSSGGEVLVLVGPAGAGKSRLLELAHELASRERLRVLSGHMLSGPTLPFSPFEEMLGPRSGANEALSPMPPPPTSRSATIAAPPEPLVSPILPLPPGRGVSRVRRMLGYLDRIEELARQGPLLLLVDDLERASPSSLQIFQFLATNVPRLDLPVLLLAASRDETWIEQGRRTGATDAEQLLQVLDGLSRSGSERLGLLPLRPLTPKESRVLLEATLEGTSLGEGTVRQVRNVVERSQGNPLFLLEGVRALQESTSRRPRDHGALHAPPGGRHPERAPPLAPVVRRLLLARLEGLPTKERQLLAMASCLGEEFESAPLEALAAAMGSPRPEEVPLLLERLADRRRVLRPVGPSRYAFAHVLFLEVLEERSAERARWSSVLAAWWERARPQDAITIARLYHAADDAARGVPWVDNAIEDVLRRQAYENVEGLVRAAHELLAHRPSALSARAPKDLALATRLWIFGATAPCRGVLEHVLAAPLPPRVRWEAEATLLNAMATLEPGRARDRFQELRAEVERSSRRSDPMLEGQLLSVDAFLNAQAGRWEECLASAEGALAALSKGEDWIWTTWAEISRAVALLSLGRWQESLRACREDRARFRGDQFAPFLALLDNLEGRVHQALGDAKKARRCFDEGLRAARRIGNVSVMSSLLANRAGAELLLGDLEAARLTIGELADLSTKFDLTLHGAWARYRWAQWLYHEGRGVEADRAFEEARAGFLAIGLEGPALLPEVYRACREHLRGDRRSATASMSKLRPFLEQLDPDERALLPETAQAWLPSASGAAAPRVARAS